MRRRFWETVLEGPIAEAALAGNESAARSTSRGTRSSAGRADDGAARGRGLSGRRRTRRSGPAHLSRAALMQKADVVLYDRLTTTRVMNLVRREAERDLCRQAARQARTAAGGDQRAAGPRQRRQAGAAPQGRRSVHVRPRRRGDRDAGRARHPLPGVSRRDGGDRRIGLCRHSAHPPRPRAGLVFVTGHGKDGRIDLDWRRSFSRARPSRSTWDCAISSR